MINITISKTFGIYDFPINYSYYWGNTNTFDVLPFIQVYTDKNIDTFGVLTVTHNHTDNNKFMK